MSDLKVTSVEEHKDGGATFHFDIDSDCREAILDVGLKLLLYCGLLGVSTEEMFDLIIKHYEEPE